MCAMRNHASRKGKSRFMRDKALVTTMKLFFIKQHQIFAGNALCPPGHGRYLLAFSFSEQVLTDRCRGLEAQVPRRASISIAPQLLGDATRSIHSPAPSKRCQCEKRSLSERQKSLNPTLCSFTLMKYQHAPKIKVQ